MKVLSCKHSDLNDQNLFHSTIDILPGVPGLSKIQTIKLKSTLVSWSAKIQQKLKKRFRFMAGKSVAVSDSQW